jgi:hypothetical protein
VYSALDLPRPRRDASVFAGLAACALLLDAAPSLPWPAGVVAAGFFVLAGAIRTFLDHRELAAVRRSADRLIVLMPSTRDASELIRWRSLELTSRQSREALSREIDRLLRSVDAGRLPSAAPVQRIAVRRERTLFVAVRERVAGQRAIAARGVLLLRGVLHDPASPLYTSETQQFLGLAVRRALGALEP